MMENHTQCSARISVFLNPINDWRVKTFHESTKCYSCVYGSVKGIARIHDRAVIKPDIFNDSEACFDSMLRRTSIGMLQSLKLSCWELLCLQIKEMKRRSIVSTKAREDSGLKGRAARVGMSFEQRHEAMSLL